MPKRAVADVISRLGIIDGLGVGYIILLFAQTIPKMLHNYLLFASPGPNIFQIGSFTLRWYGLLIAAAVLIGVNLSIYLAKKRQINGELIGDLSIWLVLAAIPGARLYYVLFKWGYYSQHPAEIIAIWQGGIAIHGAIIGGTLAALIFSKIKQVDFWNLADVITPSLVLGQAIGRWGNFFNSEAFGAPIEAEVPWKLYIPAGHRPDEFLDKEYFHPTFLYESLWDLGVFGMVMFLFLRSLRARQPLKNGSLFMIYLIAYSLGRFWIEGLRTDSLMLGSVKMAQVISLIGFAIGVTGLIWLYRHRSRVSLDN
jgi:phosphatidylglycerol---prolipoprotein diacylglyceryl transferase